MKAGQGMNATGWSWRLRGGVYDVVVKCIKHVEQQATTKCESGREHPGSLDYLTS